MNRRALLVFILGCLAMPGLSGCFLMDGPWGSREGRGGEPWSPPGTSIPEPYSDGTLIAHSGAQFGDMGRVRDFASDAVVTSASYYGRGASLRLDSLGGNWWVMSALTIDNFDIVNAPAGTYRMTSREWNGEDPYASVTGCSGPSYGNFDFDENSSDVELALSDNPDGTRTLEFTVRYDFGRQATTGTVVFEQGRYSPPTYQDPTLIVATGVTQEGSMGGITRYTSTAEASSGYYYGNYASIRLDSTGAGWWVMSALSVGNLDLANAPEGTYRSVVGVYDDPNDPQLSVTGCSGPSYGNFDFDAPSEETEIVLRDNVDGSRSIELSAVFAYGGARQVARARFDFVVESSGGAVRF